MKRDEQATAAKHFKDPGSFVFKDGREWLEGEDWDNRRFELLQRARGQCEYTWCPAGPSDAPMNRCFKDAQDPHHKILRSIARDDRMSNLLAVCRPHHDKLTAEQRKQHGKNKLGFKPVGA